ncbi:hypothetical protein YC2023_009727 [Brassica napus]
MGYAQLVIGRTMNVVNLDHAAEFFNYPVAMKSDWDSSIRKCQHSPWSCLPWQGLKVGTKKQKYDVISEKKVSTPIETRLEMSIGFSRPVPSRTAAGLSSGETRWACPARDAVLKIAAQSRTAYFVGLRGPSRGISYITENGIGEGGFGCPVEEEVTASGRFKSFLTSGRLSAAHIIYTQNMSHQNSFISRLKTLWERERGGDLPNPYPRVNRLEVSR